MVLENKKLDKEEKTPDLAWLDDPEVFRVGQIKAHSDHHFFDGEETYQKQEESLCQCLNGTWQFAWSKNPASKIQRIVERFELGKVDKAAIVTESQKAVEKREALEKDKPTKTKNEIITEEAVRKPIQKEGYSQSNPTVAKTDKNPPSRHDSEPVDMQTDKGTVSDRQRKPSVKAKLDRYKAQSKQQKEAERKEPEVSKPEVKNAPAQTVHQQPKPKSKNVKER